MLDVYSWILSPEIREYLRANYPLSVEEKVQIICGGFRSIEEKEAALRALLEESGEKLIGEMVRLYGLAMEELRRSGPECLFVLPSAHLRPGKTDFPVACDAAICASYEELLECAEDTCLCASKWERTDGTWKSAIEFDVQRVDGALCSTRFWLSEEAEAAWGIDEETMDLQRGDGWGQISIPFQTGDLVKLDAPMLKKPLFGVMNNVLDLNGTRYLWFGYVEGNHFNALDLSCTLFHCIGGYRVMDWLHSAKPEELPEDEKILREIGEYLSSRPRRDSDADNEFYDFFGVKNKRVFRHWTEIPFLELLAQARKEREEETP